MQLQKNCKNEYFNHFKCQIRCSSTKIEFQRIFYLKFRRILNKKCRKKQKSNSFLPKI